MELNVTIMVNGREMFKGSTDSKDFDAWVDNRMTDINSTNCKQITFYTDDGFHVDYNEGETLRHWNVYEAETGNIMQEIYEYSKNDPMCLVSARYVKIFK